jgi:hypothetical protein
MKRFALIVCLLLPSVAYCKPPSGACTILREKDSFSGDETFHPQWRTKPSHKQHYVNLDFHGIKATTGTSFEMIVSYKEWVRRGEPDRKFQPVSVEVKVGERIFKFETDQFTFNIDTRPDFWADTAASNWTDIHVRLTPEIVDALHAEGNARVRITKDDGEKEEGEGPGPADVVCLRMFIDEYKKLSATSAGEKPAQP